MDPGPLLDVLTLELRSKYGYEQGFKHKRCVFFVLAAHLVAGKK
jgi:hypothetical protein